MQTVRTIAVILTWLKAIDPSRQQIKIELFYGLWVFLFEASWIIYGNTFIYSDDVTNCHYITSFTGWDIQDERITALVLIVWGYILLLGIVFGICFYAALFFGDKSYT